MSPMQPAVLIEKHIAIAFDADVLAEPKKVLFEEDYWYTQNSVTGTAKGRGNSWFIDAPFGQVALRKYLRGGWAARISRDRYFYTGVDRSRPFQEFSVLVALQNLGLPVPKPVAALCEHQAFLSRGALITGAIADVQTLADYLPPTPGAEEAAGHMPPAPEAEGQREIQSIGADSSVWQSTGQCIRRFHTAGLWHADLNARNILVDKNQQVYLIDFDRARYTPGTSIDGHSNLARLKRSLNKLCPQNYAGFVSKAWSQLMAGYDG